MQGGDDARSEARLHAHLAQLLGLACQQRDRVVILALVPLRVHLRARRARGRDSGARAGPERRGWPLDRLPPRVCWLATQGQPHRDCGRCRAPATSMKDLLATCTRQRKREVARGSSMPRQRRRCRRAPRLQQASEAALRPHRPPCIGSAERTAPRRSPPARHHRMRRRADPIGPPTPSTRPRQAPLVGAPRAHAPAAARPASFLDAHEAGRAVISMIAPAKAVRAARTRQQRFPCSAARARRTARLRPWTPTSERARTHEREFAGGDACIWRSHRTGDSGAGRRYSWTYGSDVALALQASLISR